MTKHIPIMIKIAVTFLLAGAIFAYTHLIQRELMVANNQGKLIIISSGKTIKEKTQFYQNISKIAINGRPLDSKYIKENEWASQKLDAVNNSYFTSVEASLTIDFPSPIKSITFEHQKDEQNGILQFYLDGDLIQEVDSYSEDFSLTTDTVTSVQQIGLNQSTIFWHLCLLTFVLSSFIFVIKEIYKEINSRQIIKFSSLSLFCLLSLSASLDYLYGETLSLFNSNIPAQEIILLALLTLFFIAISLTALSRLIPNKIKRFIKAPYHLVLFLPPLIASFLMENSYSSMNTIQPSAFFYNLLLITVIYLALSWVSTSFKVGGSLLLVLATSFGILNKLMIDTRSQPLLYFHLLQLRDGLNIANATKLVFDNNILQSIFLAWIGVTLLLYLPKLKINIPSKLKEKLSALFTSLSGKILALPAPFRDKIPSLPDPFRKKTTTIAHFFKHKIPKRVLFSFSGLLISALFLPSLIMGITKVANIKLNYWQMQETYAKSGSLLAMASFYEDSLIKEPENYSLETVTTIADKYEPAEVSSKQRPNIIIIQNESQTDFSNLENLDLSPDPLSFQHSLTTNTVHGNLNVSVYGGGTANTEYEVLTSNSPALLSSNIFPYQQLIDGDRHSFASLLSKQGYQTVALHPQSSLNYNRDNVYNAFGFSETYFLDSKPGINSLYQLKMERNFVSDHSLFEGVQKLYTEKEDKPLFTFVVTMQGHGSYNTSDYEKKIAINGSTENFTSESEFFTSMSSTDQAFKNLIAYFQDYDEPTVVIMYGDHQPSLSKKFYQTFLPDSLDSTSNLSATYTTPFLIWANFDIPETTPTTISPNFLVPYTINLLEQSSAPLPTSSYYEFLTTLQTHVPIITTWGYKTNDGTFYEQLNDHQLLKNYAILEYNNAIDKKTLDHYFE